MKTAERDKARLLRKQGHSMNEIVNVLGVAKSSVSLWVRNIKLTDRQRRKLSKKGHSLDAIEKRRSARIRNEFNRRQTVFQAAKQEIVKVSQRDLFHIGLGLYWGEGSKYSRGSVCFYNSDPRLIQMMKRFFIEVCRVPPARLKGQVLLHPHLKARRAEKYWSGISGIPLSQFQKTSQQHNKASKGKKDKLPRGTFMIGVYDTKLFLTIMGWMEGTYQGVVPLGSRVPDKYASVL